MTQSEVQQLADRLARKITEGADVNLNTQVRLRRALFNELWMEIRGEDVAKIMEANRAVCSRAEGPCERCRNLTIGGEPIFCMGWRDAVPAG